MNTSLATAAPLRSPSTRPDRDLVAAIRGELAAVEPPRACCREAELAGLAARSRRRTPTRAAARLTARLLAAKDRVSAADARNAFDWTRAEEHCRIAYLRGCFLARGSLSLAAGRTHLEFVVPVPEARVLGSRLADMGLPGVVRLRRGAGVVTWKGATTVLTFLRLAGATASALELEARLVGRNLRGQLNRVVNAESANLRRQVVASSRQLRAIDLLEDDGRLARQSHALRAVAAARRDAPEASLTELAARLDFSRALVQRCLERIESLALEGEEASARNG